MKEEWKWIPGFEGKYQASTLGRIKSFKQSKEGLIMTGTSSRDGRIRVNLEGKKYLVHRLILLTFNPEGKLNTDEIVLHIDGNPTNNCINNLKWGTYKENAQDVLAIQRNKQTQQLSKEKRILEQQRIISDERWKDIPGYNGDYQISDYGRVRSFKKTNPKIMSLIKQTSNDYYTIGLCLNGKKKHYSVDRLVAEAFLFKPDGCTEVNHIDENTLNNYYKNLEWCTHAQNTQHSIYRQSIPVLQYDLEDNFIAEYSSIAEAARQTNTTRYGIYNIFRGKQKTAGGYKWKKKTDIDTLESKIFSIKEDIDGAEKN